MEAWKRPFEEKLEAAVRRLAKRRLIAFVGGLIVVIYALFTSPLIGWAVRACEAAGCPTPQMLRSDHQSAGRCEIVSPPDGTRVNGYVPAEVRCSGPVDTARFFILVYPPVFPGQPQLSTAVFPLYVRTDGTYFGELVVGIPASSDAWPFTACLVLVTDQGLADINQYFQTDDRSGIRVPPPEQKRFGCVALIHDPKLGAGQRKAS